MTPFPLKSIKSPTDSTESGKNSAIPYISDRETINKLSSIQQKKKPTPPITNTAANENSKDEEDVLNENISDERNIKAMEKAEQVLSKSKTQLHLQANPSSKDSWLITTMKTIIHMSDKIISPHKYRFENTQEVAKFNTKLLKKDRYDFNGALCREN